MAPGSIKLPKKKIADGVMALRLRRYVWIAHLVDRKSFQDPRKLSRALGVSEPTLYRVMHEAENALGVVVEWDLVERAYVLRSWGVLNPTLVSDFLRKRYRKRLRARGPK